MGTPTLSNIGIPSWAQTQLQQLAAQGKLSGVNPVDIGLIGRAESSFNPGNYNSSGYGGYFGTSQAESGVSNPTNPSTFGQQAQAAARVYAAGLRASGGNVVGAENYYQTGSTAGNRVLPLKDGSVLFNNYFGTGVKQATPAVTTANSSGSGSFTPSTPPSLSLGPFSVGLEGLVSGGISGAVIIGAVILVLAAALLLTKGGGGSKVTVEEKAAPNTNTSSPTPNPATDSGAEVLFDGDPYA